MQNVRELRKKLQLNQTDFWGAVNVNQSTGCRYESGRPIPKPVLTLLQIHYVHKIDLAKINKRNAGKIRQILDAANDSKLRNLKEAA